MELKKHQRNLYKNQIYRDLVILLITILLINYIASFFYIRIDLTEEKRFTLTGATKKILKNLNDIVYVKVYLEGEMPYGFKRLNKSIKETLDEFRSYAGDNIQYEFINPTDNPNKKSQKELFKQLYQKGLKPTTVQEKDDEGKISEKVLFPGALISYGGREVAVDFLRTSMNLSPEENLNASVEDVEFSIINAIRKLKNDFGQRIAFIEGHGESSADEVEDITRSLSEYFEVERVRLDSQIYSLSMRQLDSNNKVTVVNKYDLAIIANPDSMFSEFDKYIIDQFIMYGGKVIWLIDAVNANMDSLAYSSTTMATIKNLNLNDQLFKYGARVNSNLIQDIQCAIIPVNTAIAGTQPRFSPFPWVYFPLLMPNIKHPIGKNVNLIKGQFVSSVDPVGDDPSIKKTVLLTTSQNSRVINAPLQINLSLIKKKLNPDFFTKSYIPAALLLEGNFNSIYQNRLAPEMYEHQEIAFKERSYYTQLAVIGDGDMIKNHVKRLGFQKEALPLGYDRYTGQTFGNKEFLMNLISYMLDNKNFIELHSKVVQLRLLNRTAIEENKTIIQLINVALPAFLILAFGLLLSWYRKQKFSNKQTLV